MKIRAKFTCSSVAKDSSGNETSVFHAAHGEENKQWSKWTPSGNLSIGISVEGAQGQFTPGKSYILELTPAD